MTEVQQRTSATRRIAAGILGLLPLSAVAVTWLMWQDKLPAELASHWSDTGAPDDFMTTGTALGLGLALTGIPGAIALVSACMSTLRPALLRGILGFAGMISGMGAGTWLISAGLTLQAGSAENAVLGWWLAALIASFLFGAIPYFTAPKPQFTTTRHETRLPLGEQESGAWSRTITSKMLLWMPVALLALTAALYLPAVLDGSGASWIGLGTMLASVIVVSLLAHLQVTVDWRGLRIVSTLGRIPLKRIRLEDIVAVEVTEIRPAEWGGWGYRVMPGRSAVVMGAGPGLVITTTAEKQFAVTVADPGTAASLLLALRDRKHDGGSHPSATEQTV
ncbi:MULTISPECIES: hypothetical protein [Arthrobacter]|uniref:hypothetical protein n=1 Tax=Arthrobacter TaxID=1663 RepID=UPI0005360882|nr:MULTISPECIES: hypothetical protein [Arthrobacter]AIY03935.1 hypothetical protein ART_4336 [Arthrobacter sp. PAMC 25486]